jgi:hypothetical protein
MVSRMERRNDGKMVLDRPADYDLPAFGLITG